MGVTPGSVGADFDVLLAFSLDEEANKRVQARTTTIEQELKRIQDQASKAGKAINTAMQGVDKKADAAQKSVTKIGVQLAQLGARAKQSSTQVNQAVDSNIRKYKELEESAKRAASQAKLVSNAAARAGSIFGQGLIAGGAIAGGILAEANRYAREEEAAGRATQATREWTKATEELARARGRVDNVLLRESLPLLQEAARVANQAAGFIEKHPDIVRAALNVGVVVAGLSAVGLAVSKGVKLVADVRYLTAVATELLAAKLHNQAADKQLAAATVTNRADDLRRGLGQAPSRGAELVGTISKALIIAEVAHQATNFVLEKIGQPKLEAMFEAETSFIRRLPEVIVGKIKLNDLAAEIVKATQATAGVRNAGGASANVNLRTNTANDQAIVNSFTKWKEDDARLISEAADKRKQIIADAEKAIADATARYGAQRVQINRQFDSSRASLVSNYAKDLTQTEANYEKSRADIIKGAGEEIQRIEADHQEAIRKMTLDHNQRVEDFTAARDALGLVKEERRFALEKAESERDINREIAQRRQDIARRLTDLAEQYTAERAQKQQQFQEALKENEARRQEELKQAADAYQAERQQARDSKAQQLRDLQEGLNAERLRRREVFIAEIRDLDASLLGERNKKQQYYNLMLQDAEKWLAAYRAKLAGGTSTNPFAGVSGTGGAVKVHDYSGYAYPGMYQMAANGQRQFVLGGGATRAAEQIIGSQLNQDNLMRALTASRSIRQATYNDQRKLYQTPSKDMLALMAQAADKAIEKMVGG